VRAAVVTTGAVNGNDWQIDSGLSPGEVVVVAGANLLHEGQKVRPLP
jgi:multidrug efflux pump subunit AcrA (membrane-fusion protein)